MLVAFALLALLPGRISLPPLDRDESRYLEASRQMLDDRDPIDIRFQDRPRWLQPAGIYWLESLSVLAVERVAGTRAVEAEAWPFRIPSLLAGIGNVVLTASIGARLFGPEAGLLAGIAFGASVLATAEGHMATIDTVLLLAILVAMRALAAIELAAAASRPIPARARVAFWLAIGCGLMLKGPVVLIPCLGTPLALCAAARGAAPWRRLRPATGIALALSVVLPWSAAILWRTGGAFFRASIGVNLLGKVAHGQQAHGAPPGSYLAMFPLAFWPGFVFAVAAVPLAWARRREPAVRLLLAWILVQWLVFEAIATKLPHYVLPAYPAIACLVGASLVARAPAGRGARIAIRIAAVLWLAIGLAAAAAGPVLLAVIEHARSAAAVAVAVAAAFLVVAAFVLLWRDRPRAALLTVAAAALATYAGLFTLVIPALDTIWLSPRIARTVAAIRPCPGSVLASASFSEPSLVFEVGRDTRLLEPGAAAAFLAADPACGLALVDRRDLARFRAALTVPVRKLAEVDGVNLANGRHLALSVFGGTRRP